MLLWGIIAGLANQTSDDGVVLLLNVTAVVFLGGSATGKGQLIIMAVFDEVGIDKGSIII